MPKTDYVELYNLERYLFDTVGPRFRIAGRLSAFDFFCIVLWKAPRSKQLVARRIRSRGPADLDEAITQMAEQLRQAKAPEQRLNLLCDTWALRLSMASAVLTVLYPEEFAVYDLRVCDELQGFGDLGNVTQPERRWAGYVDYRNALRAATPTGLSLRDKDRWLWGKSFATELLADIAQGFEAPTPADEA
jgi:hypothetical protein